MLHPNEEAAKCLLCHDAPCGANVARAIRALRFDNRWTAAELFDQLTDSEIAAAQAACIHYDQPIRISELKAAVCNQQSAVSNQPDQLLIAAFGPAVPFKKAKRGLRVFVPCG